MLFVFLDMPSHVTQSTIESFFRTHSGLRYVDVLREFDAFMALRGCTPSTRYTRLGLVAIFLRWVENKGVRLEDLTRHHLLEFLSERMRSVPRSLRSDVEDLRAFLKFLRTKGIEVELDFKPPRRSRNIPEVLSEAEVVKLVNMVREPRFRLFIALAYETGARKSELLHLRLKDVGLGEEVSRVVIRQSKSEPRVVPVVLFNPLLRKFWGSHPAVDPETLRPKDPEAYLFYSTRGFRRHMSYTTVTYMFQDLSEKVGRRIYPHLLRHSRGTHLIKMGLTEKEVMMLLGHRTRAMVDVYVHITARDVEEKLLEMYGIRSREEVRNVTCVRCGHTNPSGANYCVRCGHPLNVEEASKVEERLRRLEEMMNRFEKLLRKV